MIRRAYEYAGAWTLIALIAFAMVFTASALPKAMNHVADQGLRDMLGEASYRNRDLLFTRLASQSTPDNPWEQTAGSFPGQIGPHLGAPLAGLLGSRWGWISSGRAVVDGESVTTAPDGFKPRVALAHEPDLIDALTVMKGRLPNNAPPGDIAPEAVQVIASDKVVRDLGLELDRTYSVTATSGVHTQIHLVGVFVPIDASTTDWEPHGTVLAASTEVVAEDYLRLVANLLTDANGMRALDADAVAWELQANARFRLDESRIDAGAIGATATGLLRLGSNPELSRNFISLSTGLDDLLDGFSRKLAAAQALLAVVVAGVLGSAAGLLVIAARMAVDRRSGELRLLRARGCSLARLVGRIALEGCLTVAPAVALGWVAHLFVAGRSEAITPVVGAVCAAAAILAVPVTVLHSQRDPLRRSVIVPQHRARRLMTELTVLLLAVLGTVLLHRRGLALAGIDPYLAAVPVLIAAAGALVGLRLYPLPVRALMWGTTRSRGAAAFVGFARTARSGAAFAMPLVVLVLALSLGFFASSVRSGVIEAGEVAAVNQVGADYRLTATEFTPELAEFVGQVRDVEQVVAARQLRSGLLVIDGAQQQAAVLVALDPLQYERLLAGYGIELDLSALRSESVAGAVPVVASSRLAARLDKSTLAIDGEDRAVHVVGTVDRLPGLDGGQAEFLVIPATMAPADAPITALLVAGAKAHPSALRQAGGVADMRFTSLAEQRHELKASQFSGGITLVFTVGLAAAVIAGLLAVGLMLVGEARTRGRTLSLLRTMGLSGRQSRFLVLVELAPMMITAVVIGAAIGIALPQLLAPALGLAEFNSGVHPEIGWDALTIGMLPALLVGLLGAGVLIEAAANRRLGLGGVLRVQSE